MDGQGKEILINDTVGFIRDLPPTLIQAFRSTLEDSIEADLLLHVIDATDPLLEDKIQVVDEILNQIGAQQPRIMVLNKIDMLKRKSAFTLLKKRFPHRQWVLVSAVSGQGIDALKMSIRDAVC